jgi:hypothetical protein
VFPAAPLRTGREVLPHPALHRPSARSLSGPALAQASGRSPRRGADQPRRALLPAARLLKRGPAARPSLDQRSVVAGRLTVLCPAPTPSRWAVAPGEEGLSSSWSDCPHVPFPIRRGVLRGCPSKVFPTSLAFAFAAQARLPLGPWRSPARVNLTARQDSRYATDRTLARPPEEDFVSGLRRPDLAARRRSATRQLGLYLGRTFTGKPDQA